MNVREELFKNRDLSYRDFHSKLVPNINRDLIIGVRVPVMRKLARQAVKENAEFKIEYYEEKQIAGLMIGYKKCPLEQRLEEIKEFIPYIDCWGICDTFCSNLKFAEKNREAVWDFIQSYLGGSEYEIRFAVVMMMDYFIVDAYIDDVIFILTNIKSDKYYVNMAVAWALSVAFVKYQDKVIPFLENKLLSKTVNNMTIQKISDSFRVDKQIKAYVKTLRQ